MMIKDETTSLDKMENVFEALGGNYKDRLIADRGVTLYYSKDEALETLRDFDSEMFGSKTLEVYLDKLKFPIIAIPIMAYEGDFDLNTPRWTYKDWLFDSSSNNEVIKETAKKQGVPIHDENSDLNDFNFEEWLSLIEDSFLKVKSEIKNLYEIKFLLDKELSTLFVEKVSVFYKEIFHLYDGFSMEAPEPVSYLKKLLSSDIEKFGNSFSDLLYFKTVVEDLTGIKVEYPRAIREVWVYFKRKYLEDFVKY